MATTNHDWNGTPVRFLCPDHVPVAPRPLGSDDSRLRCDVCGVTGYHVRPVPVEG